LTLSAEDDMMYTSCPSCNSSCIEHADPKILKIAYDDGHHRGQRNLKKPEETSRNPKKPEETSRNLKKPQETSRNLKKSQETSRNLKKPQEPRCHVEPQSEVFGMRPFGHLRCIPQPAYLRLGGGLSRTKTW
jgi:hypothetical protein